MTAVLVVGDHPSLVKRWGTQKRLQSPCCRRYLPDQPEVTCPCGVTYRCVGGDDYEVVSVRA